MGLVLGPIYAQLQIELREIVPLPLMIINRIYNIAGNLLNIKHAKKLTKLIHWYQNRITLNL